jgi:hypothetical protein
LDHFSCLRGPIPSRIFPEAFLEDSMAKKKKRYHVGFDIELEETDVRIPQIESWVRYHVGDKGRLRRDNPLYGKTLDPIYGSLKVLAEK